MWTFDFKLHILTARLSHPLDRRASVRRPRILKWCVAATAFCFLSTAYRLSAVGGLYAVREVKPHVFVWVPEDVIDQEGDPEFSRAGTAGFLITSAGVVVVDTTNSHVHARELLYEIRRRTDAPVKYVINTGSSGDHVLGNEVFIDQRSVIVSTAAAQSAMRRYWQEIRKRLEDDWRLQARMRGFHTTLPVETFEGERRLDAGGQEIALLSPGAPSATGDLMVYLPQAKVLFLGDLYQNRYFPRLDSRAPARDIRHWIETLALVESWDVEFYIPGHGAPGGKKEVAEFRQFLTWLAQEVETRIKEGKSLDQVKRDLEAPLENYHWHAPELAAPTVEAVYQQLVGALPAAP